MTLEELKKCESERKANNPYFRNKIGGWRRYALYVLDEKFDPTKVSVETLMGLWNEVADYANIIVEDQDMKMHLAAVLKKLSNFIHIESNRTVEELNAEANDDDY